ncbi:MAG: hypothetical protein AAF561_16185, partial [Planctomycetota bacterium]
MAQQPLPAVERHIRSVRRKMVVQGFIRRFAVALVVLGAVAWITAVVLRLTATPLPGGPWAWIGGGAGVAAVVALVFAWRGRPSDHDAAVAIDERLGTHERFSTALERVGHDDPFSRLAVADASRAAQSANLRKKFPLAWPPTYAGVAAWAGVVGLTVWLVEPIASAEAEIAEQQDREDAAA